MKHRTLIIVALVLLLPIITVFAFNVDGVLNSDRHQESAGIPFPITYQGELTDNDLPQPGPCDFEFSLWSAPELGTQIGTTQTLSSVPLYDGRFTVRLNSTGQFGSQAFNGDPRFLDISVDCPSGTGSFTPLEPRQPLMPAPYAYYSLRAASALWSGIVDMPLDFADGTDNDSQYEAGTGLELVTTFFELMDSYQLPQGCSTGQVAEWSGPGWDCVTPIVGGGPQYANVVVVAKSGGDYSTIQGAVDSVTGAAAESRYLVWVAPGVYSETVDMKSYVDIEGAGRDLTKISSVGAPGSLESTVQAAEHTWLRDLTVENTGDDAKAVAIDCDVDDFNIIGVNIIVSGATSANKGISYIAGPLTSRVEDTLIIVDVDGSVSNNYAVDTHATYGRIELILDHVTIQMTGAGTNSSYGIYQTVNTSLSGAITATNMLINVHNSGTQVGSLAYGLYSNMPGGKISLSDSIVRGISPAKSGIGLFTNNGSTSILRNVTLEGNTHGLWIDSSGDPNQVEVYNSQITGGTYSVKMAGSAINTLHIAGSMLDGNYTIAAGNIMTCFGSYDEHFTNGQVDPFNTCP